MRIIITGSHGLIGSEAVQYYAEQGHDVLGVDNNMRNYFFGPSGDTNPIKRFLESQFKTYRHKVLDIRDRDGVSNVFIDFQPDVIIHTAAQPSHDWAAREPFTDFDVNAVGTLNLLEAMRLHSPKSIFIFMSTNKVYGDGPNHLLLEESESRFDYQESVFFKHGIGEHFSVDQSLHSLFGASKLSADILSQEYGKYFHLKVGVFRGGCLTGPQHKAVPLHGFLTYLVLCALEGKTYVINGYKGKQVRDQIHSRDVIQAFECFRKSPREGEVYNLGGGYSNSASILEVISILKGEFGLCLKTEYRDQARIGDHICYYSDLRKLKKHFPEFNLTMNLPNILSEMIDRLSLKKVA